MVSNQLNKVSSELHTSFMAFMLVNREVHSCVIVSSCLDEMKRILWFKKQKRLMGLKTHQDGVKNTNSLE